MDIKSVKKQKDQFDNETNVLHVVTEDDVVTFVPIDPANVHYAEILKQVDAGTLTIKDAD